jgi:hypothetical protein
MVPAVGRAVAAGDPAALAIAADAVSTLLMCVPTVYPVEIGGCALFLLAGLLLAAPGRPRAAPGGA